MGRLRWVIMPLFGLQGPIEVFSPGCAVGGRLCEASAAGQRHGCRSSTSWRYRSSGPGEFECCTPGKAFVSRTNFVILTPHEETTTTGGPEVHRFPAAREPIRRAAGR